MQHTDTFWWFLKVVSLNFFLVILIEQLITFWAQFNRACLIQPLDSATNTKLGMSKALSTCSKQFVSFPPSSLALFQEYLHPHRTTENDSKRCSSHSRPLGGAWNSPWMGKKRLSMHIKLARCLQTVEGESEKKKTKMASARKPEAFVCIDYEVELLLWLTLE